MVIGVEPASLEVGFEPSEIVQAALPDVIQRVIRQLNAWGIEVRKK